MKRNSKHISLLLWALTIRNTYIFRQLIMLYLSWPWLNLGIQPCVWARKPDWMPSQCQAGTSLASNSVSACKQRVGSQVSSKLGSWLGSQCQRIQGTPRLVQSSTSDHVRAGMFFSGPFFPFFCFYFCGIASKQVIITIILNAKYYQSIAWTWL